MPALVSVTIPCYNARETLPLALASLLAQTYSNWECIIVDDGSNDSPQDIIEHLNDDRIRFHRFTENRGRATARQQALDMAKGDYLTMIDADDWIYPQKFSIQVELMDSHPDVALISTGLAVANEVHDIVGVRVEDKHADIVNLYPSLSQPRSAPFFHPASMLRMCIAKETGYNSAYKFSEDADFLISIIMQYGYGVMPEVYYAYKEEENYSLYKMVQSIRTNHKIFSKYRKDFPYAAYKKHITLGLKEMIYRGFTAVNKDDYLIKRRSKLPTQHQIDEFKKARQIVFDTGSRLFADSPFQDLFQYHIEES